MRKAPRSRITKSARLLERNLMIGYWNVRGIKSRRFDIEKYSERYVISFYFRRHFSSRTTTTICLVPSCYDVTSAAARWLLSAIVRVSLSALSTVTEGWLEIDKHYSLELCFSIGKQPET